jgi:hypothetical protein
MQFVSRRSSHEDGRLGTATTTRNHLRIMRENIQAETIEKQYVLL